MKRGTPDKCTKNHYVWVARTWGIPGAHASCVDEPRFCADFIRRESRKGSMLQLVRCDKAYKMLRKYKTWCDQQDARPS